MASWPEVQTVKLENRHELILSGSAISKKIEDHGIDDALFLCDGLNFLRISDTTMSIMSPKIGKLNNLTSLVLHTNKLTELCPEIGKLSKLKLLDASNNELTQIPSAIMQLENLATLNLSFNKIETLPNMTQNIWLSSVDLSCNLIEDITELCHKELVHLSELRLKGNKIKVVPSVIGNLVALKMLDASDNKITQVFGEIADISKLKDINLERNPLTDKRLGKLVAQCKSKQVLDYIREHCPRQETNEGNKGKKGKGKGRVKQNSGDMDPSAAAVPKHQITVSKAGDVLIVKRTEYVEAVRPHVVACVVRGVALDGERLRKFIQLQTRLHDSVCDKRNAATIATHDLDKCGGATFTYTALSPDGLVILPLNRTKEVTGRELFTQLQNEAEALRKEKKRNTYSGIHKYLYLLDKKPLYPCLLNSDKTVISCPPITNSDVTKMSTSTKSILIEVTSSASQGVAKKVCDALLKEMVLSGVTNAASPDEANVMTVEQVRVEEVDGTLNLVYPSRADLTWEDTQVAVVRE